MVATETRVEKGSINPELKTSSISMTEHAFKRAAERFNQKTKNEALGYFRSILKQAQWIGNVVAEDGNESILYAYQRQAVYLSPDLTRIITVNHYESVTYEPIKDKISQLHRKEFDKVEKVEKSQTRKLDVLKLQTAIELAQLNYRRAMTRSETVKTLCEQRIAVITNELEIKEQEINELKSVRRQIARSLVSVI
jgi:hypothetical protein